MIDLINAKFDPPVKKYKLHIQVMDGEVEALNINLTATGAKEFILILERFNLKEMAGFGKQIPINDFHNEIRG